MKTTLVSTEEFATHPEWRVFDCRHDLAAPELGAALYAQGHIQGAIHAHLDYDLSAPKTGTNGRHPLPDPTTFMVWLGKQGVHREDQVIAYDDSGGIFAARLWWMMRWVGHPAAAVLDGGYAKWLREGRQATSTVPMFRPVDYTGRPSEAMLMDADAVESNLRTHRFQLIDARAANRYAGNDETMDPVAGHIPGAINRPYALNLSPEGIFKQPEVLRSEFLALMGDLQPDRIVSQCGSGVTACHNLLAMEIAALPGARLYAGSWSEWCSDPRRPTATGSLP